MRAHIISIGNELLIGDTVNTNATWLGRALSEKFISVDYVHTIKDDYTSIFETLSFALKQADVVLMTGGLGPTNDDITKKVVADYYETKLVVDQATLDHIKDMFKKLNITFSKSNYGQAEVPEACEVLFNSSGTAPGMWFWDEHGILAVMPGVPSEMKHLMNRHILPRLMDIEEVNGNSVTQYIKTAGVGESTLSDVVLNGIDTLLNEHVKLASLPNNGGVTFRITAQSSETASADHYATQVTEFIKEKANDYIYAWNREGSLAEAVGRLLTDKKWTIATAESCTGGLLSGALTDVPGSSQYTLGGIVSYANDLKINQLGVQPGTLNEHGAVSKQVALQMAEGVRQKTGADVGVSTTGIAGPGGGTDQKPVGTIWMGFAFPEQHFATKVQLTKNRQRNRERTVKIVLETVRRRLKGIDELPYGLECVEA